MSESSAAGSGVPSPSEPAGPGGPDLESPDAAGRAEPGVAAPPDTNQPKAEPVEDGGTPDEATVGAGDPQGPGALNAPGSVASAGGAPGDSQGVVVPSTQSAPGTSQEQQPADGGS